MSVLEEERRYTGQEDAVPIVRWLNEHRNNRAGQRVASLVLDLTALCSTVTPWEARMAPPEWERLRVGLLDGSIRPQRGSAADPKTWLMLGRSRDYSEKAFHRAQAALARYTFRPVLVREGYGSSADIEKRGRKSALAILYGEDMTVQTQSSDQRFEVELQARSGRRALKDESYVVWHVIRLLEAGLIERVRQCSCGVWFFAHNTQMRHHNARCRHHDYKSTPAWRQKRNRYMREYYRKFQSPKAAGLRKRGK